MVVSERDETSERLTKVAQVASGLLHRNSAAVVAVTGGLISEELSARVGVDDCYGGKAG